MSNNLLSSLPRSNCDSPVNPCVIYRKLFLDKQKFRGTIRVPEFVSKWILTVIAWLVCYENCISRSIVTCDGTFLPVCCTCAWLYIVVWWGVFANLHFDFVFPLKRMPTSDISNK